MAHAPAGAWTTDAPDSDGDGVVDASDNCPDVPNSDQTNTDGGKGGDACDSDDDNDGVKDVDDNCVTTENSDQADADSDGIGTACDRSEMPTTKKQCKKGGWRKWHRGSKRFRN